MQQRIFWKRRQGTVNKEQVYFETNERRAHFCSMSPSEKTYFLVENPPHFWQKVLFSNKYLQPLTA